MHEPISEVPKTKVKMCIFPKIASVAKIAIRLDHKIEPMLNRIGEGRWKIKSRITRTAVIEIVEIVEISFVALEELL